MLLLNGVVIGRTAGEGVESRVVPFTSVDSNCLLGEVVRGWLSTLKDEKIPVTCKQEIVQLV